MPLKQNQTKQKKTPTNKSVTIACNHQPLNNIPLQSGSQILIIPKSQWPWPPRKPVLNCGLTALDFFSHEYTQAVTAWVWFLQVILLPKTTHAVKASVLSRRILKERKRSTQGSNGQHRQLLLKFNIQTTCSNPFQCCSPFV